MSAPLVDFIKRLRIRVLTMQSEAQQLRRDALIASTRAEVIENTASRIQDEIDDAERKLKGEA